MTKPTKHDTLYIQPEPTVNKMDIWCYIERGDDGYYASTHLTEKGCLVEALENVCSVLDFEDQLGYEAFHREAIPWRNAKDKVEPKPDIFPIDQTRSKTELWEIYRYLIEYTWDCDQFDCEVVRTTIKA